jgi:hypothetical protein
MQEMCPRSRQNYWPIGDHDHLVGLMFLVIHLRFADRAMFYLYGSMHPTFDFVSRPLDVVSKP